MTGTTTGSSLHRSIIVMYKEVLSYLRYCGKEWGDNIHNKGFVIKDISYLSKIFILIYQKYYIQLMTKWLKEKIFNFIRWLSYSIDKSQFVCFSVKNKMGWNTNRNTWCVIILWRSCVWTCGWPSVSRNFYKYWKVYSRYLFEQVESSQIIKVSKNQYR